MSAGVVVISTNHAGIPEVIVSGRNGLLVNERDLVSFVGAIEHLIANRDIAREMAQQARKDAKEQLDSRILGSKLEGIILGKTNMPTMGMDIQTHNLIFGVTNNPWDLERTPGGSSGGGAAAVAAGLSPMGVRSDIGGSIRIPAHFCGIFGLKPTENMVSTAGMNPGLSTDKDFTSLRHRLSVGPMARSIDDLCAGNDNIEVHHLLRA